MRQSSRRHDLDWLRILLFGLLVPYHVGFGFIGYGDQVYGFSNQILAGQGFETYLDWSHSWRLPALFMISGVGCYFFLNRKSSVDFVKQRLLRLIVPLLFASLFLNWSMELATGWATGTPTSMVGVLYDWFGSPSVKHVMHLWFLVNLTIYSLVALPLFLHLLKTRHQLHPLMMLAIIAGMIVLTEVLKKPMAKGFFGQGYEFIYYFSFFVSGFWIMTQGERFWDVLKECRFVFLVLAVMTFILNVQVPGMYREIGHSASDVQMFVLGGWVQNGLSFHSVPSVTLALIHSLNSFFWCMAILGFGAQHLNKTHWSLPILSRLVYPFYIIHLPVMYFGFVLVLGTEYSWGLEFIALNVFTFAGSCVLVWMADQMPRARLFFGLTPPLVPQAPKPLPQWKPVLEPTRA